MSISTVVFDIGGVLVDWHPHLAWSADLGDDGARQFLQRIGFDKINLACDAGARFEDAANGIANAADAERLRQYVARYHRTVPEKLTGTWDLLYALKARGVPLHAITNWSAETWSEGVNAHPELAEVFGTIVVSGEVGIIKPSAAIYRLLCDRADLRPQDCVFVDDGLHNCIGAMGVGMDAIHFTGADALEAGLKERGLL